MLCCSISAHPLLLSTRISETVAGLEVASRLQAGQRRHKVSRKQSPVTASKTSQTLRYLSTLCSAAKRATKTVHVPHPQLTKMMHPKME